MILKRFMAAFQFWMALLHKAVLKGFFGNIISKWRSLHKKSTAQPIGPHIVETKMHCIKLLGDKLSARNFDSQVNEMHARVAILNKFTELGRPHTQVVT